MCNISPSFCVVIVYPLQVCRLAANWPVHQNTWWTSTWLRNRHGDLIPWLSRLLQFLQSFIFLKFLCKFIITVHSGLERIWEEAQEMSPVFVYDWGKTQKSNIIQWKLNISSVTYMSILCLQSLSSPIGFAPGKQYEKSSRFWWLDRSPQHRNGDSCSPVYISWFLWLSEVWG